MNRSLAAIKKQIAQLEAQAAKVRDSEKAGVIAKIRDAIHAYGITPNELFPSRTRLAGSTVSGPKSGAKYADGDGNLWSGRGPRPRWLRDALQSGRQLSDFLVGARGLNGSASNGSARGTTASRGKRRKAKVPVKYRDDAGNTWTGRGSQPRWLRAALESGKKLESFAV